MSVFEYPVVLYESTNQPLQAYQAAQWLPTLEELNGVLAGEHLGGVAVLCQSQQVANRLRTTVPVVVIPDRDRIETWLTRHKTKIVLYVNRNNYDFWLLRRPEWIHVQLGHGESDKPSSRDQIRAWDYAFVAGETAKQRYRGQRFFDPEERCIVVGRPQREEFHPVPSRFRIPDDGRVTVLYAPTWEGGRSESRYCSLASHGGRLVSELLADPRFRIIFRPHDLTGSKIATYRQYMNGITQALIEANRGGAKHVIDTPAAAHLMTREPFGWHLEAAHVAVTDVSAVALDWYATWKPMALCEPQDGAYYHPAGTWMETVTRLPQGVSGGYADLLWKLSQEPVQRRTNRELWVTRHFGPPGALDRFIDAIMKLMG